MAIVGLLLTLSCSPRPAEEEDAVTPSNDFYLSPGTLDDMKRKAKAGDGDAALNISEHYFFTTDDSATAQFYLKRSAMLGNMRAKNRIVFDFAGRSRATTASPETKRVVCKYYNDLLATGIASDVSNLDRATLATECANP